MEAKCQFGNAKNKTFKNHLNPIITGKHFHFSLCFKTIDGNVSYIVVYESFNDPLLYYSITDKIQKVIGILAAGTIQRIISNHLSPQRQY
ncbi:MAG: hypothetical protein PW786_14215 [Arachidicoccus sp.]|nr:hypothetical protein [Arachidicoccus sp.]